MPANTANPANSIPSDTAAWINLTFQGKNKDLDQLAQQIEAQLRADGYKTQSMKGSISGQPNDFSVHIGIGKWLQNAAVAAVETILFSPLALVVDGVEILWTTHIESGIAKQITKIVG